MKREVSFFRDKRAHSGKALVDTLRRFGWTDDEIRAELVKLAHGAEAPPQPEPEHTDSEDCQCPSCLAEAADSPLLNPAQRRHLWRDAAGDEDED